MSRSEKLVKTYQTLPIVLGVILLVCFIFRYSYIDFLGFRRPLILASVVCTIGGFIGSILAIIDGINKDFKGGVFKYFVINTILIFTFPILYSIETYVTPNINPFSELTPESEYSTKDRDDAAFILEGELYEWPLQLADFVENGFDYRENSNNKVSLSKLGKSSEVKPTWFTDGMRNNFIATESYNLELTLDGKGDILDQNVEAIKIRAQENNWDFELMGYSLLSYMYKINEDLGDDLTEEPNNRNTPIKYFYYQTPDGYDITLGGFQGKLQVVEIKKD